MRRATRTCEPWERQTSLPWTSSAAASPVRMSAQRASELASLVLEAASGTSSLESLERCARGGLSSRTSPAEPPSGSDPCGGGLGRLGYATLPVPIAASDCGAPHERARVFIVACRPAHGHHEVVAPPEHGGRGVGEPEGAPAHALRERCGAWAEQPAPRSHPEPAWPRHAGWAAEPKVARVVYGLPGRMDYERALGNSVVPQCAEVVGHVIRKLMLERESA